MDEKHRVLLSAVHAQCVFTMITTSLSEGVERRRAAIIVRTRDAKIGTD